MKYNFNYSVLITSQVKRLRDASGPRTLTPPSKRRKSQTQNPSTGSAYRYDVQTSLVQAPRLCTKECSTLS